MTHSQQHHVSNTRYVRTFFDLCLKNMIPFSTLSRIRHYRYIAGDYQFSYFSKCIHRFAPCKCNLWKKIWKSRFSFVQIKFIIATNCVKGVRIRSCSGLYFAAFGLYRERCSVSFRVQKNSEYGHFSRSKGFSVWLKRGSNHENLYIWCDCNFAVFSQNIGH